MESAGGLGGRSWHLAANLGFLFTELPFEQRFAAARDAGFASIESPFDHYNYPPEQVAGALAATGLRCVLINTPKGTPNHWLTHVRVHVRASHQL
jgi:hydroxypyruvate isomerase